MARCDALEKLRARARCQAACCAYGGRAPAFECCGHGRAHPSPRVPRPAFRRLYAVKENVTELRKAILQLAVLGRLVPQDPNDAPASELLKKIETEKKRLVKEGKIRPAKTDAAQFSPEEGPFPLPRGWAWAQICEPCNRNCNWAIGS